MAHAGRRMVAFLLVDDDRGPWVQKEDFLLRHEVRIVVEEELDGCVGCVGTRGVALVLDPLHRGLAEAVHIDDQIANRLQF